MYTKGIKYLSLAGIFLFPFAVLRSFAFATTFTHVMFAFLLIEILALAFLFAAIKNKELELKKSKISIAIVIYIAVMFISALLGSDFQTSFWGSYVRMTGIITMLHYAGFFLIISAVFKGKKDWRIVFRTLALSGGLLSLVSLLGVDGLNVKTFAYLTWGGSYLGNTSYLGAYGLLIFFSSIIGLSIEKNKKWRPLYIATLAIIFFSPELFNFNILSGNLSLASAIKQPIYLLGIARLSTITLWAGILLTLFLILVHRLENKKHAAKIAVVSIIVLSAIYGLGFASLMNQDSPIGSYYANNVDAVRPLVWSMAIEGVKDSPIFGYGSGNFIYVYQQHLTPQMIHLEDPPWFDQAHNVVLDELINNGFAGLLVMLTIFVLIVVTSFRLYWEKRQFYLLLLPFVFFLHILQMQTFFWVDSTIFLSLILLAFLVSHQSNLRLAIAKTQHSFWYKSTLVILLIIGVSSFVISPIKQNRVLVLVKDANSREERLMHLEKIKEAKIDPFQVLFQLAIKFETETAYSAREIQRAGLIENVAEEYDIYLDAFRSHYPRYQSHYRFLSEYANFINSAHIFGLDYLEEGDRVSTKALEISKGYPHVFWTLAVSQFYQGNDEVALGYAQKALDIDPNIQESNRVYNLIEKQFGLPSDERAFIYLTAF